MKTLHFNIHIEASAQTVWSTLWNDASYRQWSDVFAEGSHIKGELAEGKRIRFLDGNGNGVYGLVCKVIPNQLMSFINLGELFEEREQVIDERTSAREWSGAMESYMLHEKNGCTRLWLETEVNSSDAELFAQKFPKALDKIKALAEAPAYEVYMEQEVELTLRRVG